MLDRRAFLRRLGFGTVVAAAAANGVLDIERLLWVPGEKTIFLPSIKETVVCGNYFAITPDWVTRETLRMFQSNLELIDHFSTKWGDARKSLCR